MLAWFDRNFLQIYHPRRMGQRRVAGILILLAVFAAVLVMIGPGCGRVQAPAKVGGAKIASITPAGTDLVIAIGAGDRLVGVSNYDEDRAGVTGKARVGDYQNVDWEKLAQLGVNVLVLQYAPDRMPAFVQQRCEEMGIKIVNIHIDTIDDIGVAMTMLGDAIGEPDSAKEAATKLAGEIDAVRKRVEGLGKVKILVVTNDSDFSLAGPGEFLDEVVTIAGGTNAAAGLGKMYPAVDRETISLLGPEVVIRLVPGGDKKPQVVEAGDRVWETLKGVPAVKNHRVFVVTDWYCQMPNSHVGELAERFAEILHPGIMATSNPASQP
jgi:iron complex transport system substrate-binding protein